MSRSILLADDSVTIQKVVELTFMDEDYRVVAVGNGNDAIERLAEAAPDLVIADVHMPGVNGYEVCRRAKAQRPGMPVILLVGTFEPFSKDEFAACGADGYLKKPFDSQELLHQVSALLRADEPPPAAADDEPGYAEESAEAVWGNFELDETEREEPPAEPPPAPDDELEDTTPGIAETPEPAAATAPPPAAAAEPAAAAVQLSDQDVDRIARRVVEILSEKVVREVSWEVIPDLAEVIIKDRLRELESQVE